MYSMIDSLELQRPYLCRHLTGSDLKALMPLMISKGKTSDTLGSILAVRPLQKILIFPYKK